MPRNLFAAYPPPAARYDEMPRRRRRRARSGGHVRAARATAPEAARAHARLQRQMRENGVTYNVYGDPRAPTAPGNWTSCRSSSRPRNGPASKRRSCSARPAQPHAGRPLRPAAAATATGCCRRHWSTATPSTCGPAMGWRSPGGASATVRRGPDAGARRAVVGDRRPHPGAVGRRLCPGEPAGGRAPVLRRVPRLPRAALAGVLRHDARQPGDWAPPGRDAAHVLLTPGPFNETYFEHAYLARYSAYRWSKAETSRCATARCG